MLSVSDAEAIIFSLVQPLDNQRDTEIVDLLADNRILAKPVTSNLDFPHWDNSAMDGYAVRYEDVKHCSQETPAILEVVEKIPAGYQPTCTIQAGQAARIFTGAVMPQGADTVVMQEKTRNEGDRVFILSPPKLHESVRYKASYYQAGTELLPAGIKLNAPEIAILAAAQCVQLRVYRKLKVAILSSGNELVTPDQPLQPGEIVDSNQYAIASLVRQTGAEVFMLGIVKDDPEVLKQTISEAIANSDIIISSGGVSVGDYDYVEEILESLNAKIHIRSVGMKPGKPLTVATFAKPKSCLYFGLPGNPAAVLVVFWRFVQPAMRKLSGLADNWQSFVIARSLDELRSDGKRETYLWGKLNLVDGFYQFDVAGGNQSSGNLINLAQTNGLAILPVGKTLISPGEEVQVLLFG